MLCLYLNCALCPHVYLLMILHNLAVKAFSGHLDTFKALVCFFFNSQSMIFIAKAKKNGLDI